MSVTRLLHALVIRIRKLVYLTRWVAATSTKASSQRVSYPDQYTLWRSLRRQDTTIKPQSVEREGAEAITWSSALVLVC